MGTCDCMQRVGGGFIPFVYVDLLRDVGIYQHTGEGSFWALIADTATHVMSAVFEYADGRVCLDMQYCTYYTDQPFEQLGAVMSNCTLYDGLNTLQVASYMLA